MAACCPETTTQIGLGFFIKSEAMANGRTKPGAETETSCPSSSFAISSPAGAELQKYAESCLISMKNIVPCLTSLITI